MDGSQFIRGFFESMQQVAVNTASKYAKPMKVASASSSCTPCAARARIEAARKKYAGK